MDRPRLCKGEAGNVFFSSRKVPFPPHVFLSHNRAKKPILVTVLRNKLLCQRQDRLCQVPRCLVKTLPVCKLLQYPAFLGTHSLSHGPNCLASLLTLPRSSCLMQTPESLLPGLHFGVKLWLRMQPWASLLSPEGQNPSL